MKYQVYDLGDFQTHNVNQLNSGGWFHEFGKFVSWVNNAGDTYRMYQFVIPLVFTWNGINDEV